MMKRSFIYTTCAILAASCIHGDFHPKHGLGIGIFQSSGSTAPSITYSFNQFYIGITANHSNLTMKGEIIKTLTGGEDKYKISANSVGGVLGFRVQTRNEKLFTFYGIAGGIGKLGDEAKGTVYALAPVIGLQQYISENFFVAASVAPISMARTRAYRTIEKATSFFTDGFVGIHYTF